MKANELAKKEEGVAFKIKRRQGKFFAESSVCLSEVAVGKASQDLSLLKIHLTTKKHKFNATIAQSRNSEMPKEIKDLRNQIEEKFPKFFIFKERKFYAAPAVHHFLCHNDLFSSI